MSRGLAPGRSSDVPNYVGVVDTLDTGVFTHLFTIPSAPQVPSAQPPFPTDDNAFVRNLGLHVMPDASWKVLRTYAGFAIFVMGVAVDYHSL